MPDTTSPETVSRNLKIAEQARFRAEQAQHLAQLTKENKQIKEQNKQLEKRVKRLEALLASKLDAKSSKTD